MNGSHCSDNNIFMAKTAGFCYGVKRAVELVQQAVEEGKSVYTYGPIAHNRHLVAYFEKQGVCVSTDPKEIPQGATVVIRSHGIPRKSFLELQERGVEIIDATCPSVKRIHQLVEKADEEGRCPVIIGTPTHPEIVAIAGWCNAPFIFHDDVSLEEWLNSNAKNRDLPITLVSQTTGTQNLWENCKNIIKKVCTNYKFFDTICKATENRQTEAADIASQVDLMIVVGDQTSSNSKKLALICSQNCSNVMLIDNGSELESELCKYNNVYKFSNYKIGITAGASTPAWIIKEVQQTMIEKKTDVVMEESFEALLENYDKTLYTGDKVLGIVSAIRSTEVYVDLGTKHAGYIPYDEVSADPTVKPEDVLKVGDEIEVFVVHVNDQEGTVMLSRKKLEGIKVWDDVEAAYENKTAVEGIITEENKGGVVANVKGVRVFIPASQSGIAKGGELSALKGQTVKMKITEFNRQRKKVVGSIRAVNYEERKAASEKIWNDIEVGNQYHGIVKSLTSYGAFVDIGGVDGMVHVSELSWNRIKTPADVLKVGDEIDVYVISFDAEKKKISLGCKNEADNPWNKIALNDVVNVKIVKLVEFGAFAQVLPGVDGLIHISQLADRRVEKVSDVLTEGQEVEAKIIELDVEKKRISLSIRALLAPAAVEEAPVEE